MLETHIMWSLQRLSKPTKTRDLPNTEGGYIYRVFIDMLMRLGIMSKINKVSNLTSISLVQQPALIINMTRVDLWWPFTTIQPRVFYYLARDLEWIVFIFETLCK